MDNSGLTKNELEAIRKVFSKHGHVEEVLLYGSRAMGNYKPASDIDLALKGKAIDLKLLLQIEYDLDELMLPYKFDVCSYERISDPGLVDHINRVGKTLFTNEKRQHHIE